MLTKVLLTSEGHCPEMLIKNSHYLRVDLAILRRFTSNKVAAICLYYFFEVRRLSNFQHKHLDDNAEALHGSIMAAWYLA